MRKGIQDKNKNQMNEREHTMRISIKAIACRSELHYNCREIWVERREDCNGCVATDDAGCKSFNDHIEASLSATTCVNLIVESALMRCSLGSFPPARPDQLARPLIILQAGKDAALIVREFAHDFNARSIVWVLALVQTLRPESKSNTKVLLHRI